MSELAAFMDHSFTVRRATPGPQKDASGGVTKPYQPVAELGETLCCIRPVDARTKMQYQQRQMEVSHKVYPEAPVDIRKGDILDTDNGRVLLVEGWFDTDDLGRVFVIVCREQQT